MKASLTDKASRVKFLDQALDALSGPAATPTARRKLYEDFHALVKNSWIEATTGIRPVTKQIITG